MSAVMLDTEREREPCLILCVIQSHNCICVKQKKKEKKEFNLITNTNRVLSQPVYMNEIPG